MNDDEFAAGGFTVSNAKTIHAPAISEAFLTMECTLKEIRDLRRCGNYIYGNRAGTAYLC